MATDIATCQTKRCKEAIGCNKLGYCEYSAVDVYDNCCTQNQQCPDIVRPLVTFTFMGTTLTPSPTPAPTPAFFVPCTVKQCALGSCDYVQSPQCCTVNADCMFGGFSASFGQCLTDTTSPTGKSCVYGTNKFGTCSGNLDCGGNSNACAPATCNLAPDPNQCAVTPAANADCCASDADTANCQESVCRKLAANPCDDTENSLAPGVTLLPTYACNFVDMTDEGCCEASLACAESQIGCFSDTCGFADNMCTLNARDPTSSERCCYYSAQCGGTGDFGIRDTSDLCVYSECSGPVGGSVTVDTAFQCLEKTTTACPGTPPAAGLVPTLTLTLLDTECDWVCTAAPNNNVLTTYTVSNPGGSGRVLYGFDLTLMVDNGIATQTIVAMTLDSVTVSTAGRPVPVGLFTAGASATSGGLFEQTFVSSEPFSLHPGEVLTVTFETLFVGDASIVTFDYRLRAEPYDLCVAYWLAQPNCADQAAIDANNRIARNMQMDNVETVGFGNDPCDAQCLGGVIPTTPTPATPAPPAGPPIVLESASTHLRETSARLDNCQWDCLAETDTRRNILVFEVRERLITSEPTMPASAYEFDLKFETSCGPVILSDVGVLAPLPFMSAATTPGNVSFGSYFSTTTSLNTFLTIARGPVIRVSNMDNLVPGEDLRFRVFFPLSGNAPGINCVPTSGTLVMRTFKRNVECTQAAVNAGVCDMSSLGSLVIAAQQLPPLAFSFGAMQCSVPCPARTFGVSECTTSAVGTCAWDCDSDTDSVSKNLHRFETCVRSIDPVGPAVAPFAFITSLRFRFLDQNPDGLMDVTNTGPFFSSGITVTGTGISGELETVASSSIGVYSRFVAFDPPLLLLSGGEVCITLSVYRDNLVLLEEFQFESEAVTTLPCSGHEIEAGACTLAQMTAPLSRFPANFTVRSFAIKRATTLSGGASCPALCPVSSVSPGMIGGIVFLDFDANGVVSGNDTLVPGIFVQLLNAATNIVVDTALTDVTGTFEFDPLPIFGNVNVTGVATRIYYRIQAANFPFGTQGTVIGAQNPALSNTFSGTPYRSPEMTELAVRQQNAGFRIIDPTVQTCFPPFAPFADDGVVLAAGPVGCSTCTDSAPFVGECSDIVCSGADFYQVLELEYTISNYGATVQPGTSVLVQLNQLPGSVPLSDLVCVDAQAASISANMILLREKPAVLGGSNAGAAYVSIGWPRLPVGVNVHTFRVRFAYCANNEAPVFNVTATMYGDYCVDLLRRWATCDASNPDVRECYAESPVDAATVVCAGCPTPPPGATPPPTPAPTFGPVGANTPIETALTIAREGKMCVTKARIAQQLCDDEQAAFDTCRATANRGFVVVRGRLSLLTGSVALSEVGVFRLVVQRNMPSATLFCRDFDMEIRLAAERNGTLLVGALAVINSAVDATAQRMEIDVAFTPFDDLTELRIEARAIECLPSSTSVPLNYTAQLTLLSDQCTNATACTTAAVLGGSATPSAGCGDALLGEPAFASCDGPGTHVGKKYSHLLTPGLSTLGQVLLYVFLALAVVCCCLCLCCLVARGQRTGADTVETGASKPPAKACRTRRKHTLKFGEAVPPQTGSKTRKRTNKKTKQ